MQGCIGIHNEIAGEELLDTLPGGSQFTVHLPRLILGELIGQIQAIEAVVLHQIIGRSDKSRLTHLLALQQLDILVRMLHIDVMIAAHAEQDLQVGVLPLQGRHLRELVLVNVQVLVQTVRLVVVAPDSRIAVHQVRAELHSDLQIGIEQLAQAWKIQKFPLFSMHERYDELHLSDK